MKLADQMREHGYLRSADEINTRIKNLKCFYNRIKKDVEMGIITEPTWKHYAAMDEIVTRPVFGNRHQQPHLQHLLQPAGPTMVVLGGGAATSSGGGVAGAVGGGSDLDSTDGLRPEDLLSVKGDEDADVDFEGATLVPKDEPVDMDEMAMDQHKYELYLNIFCVNPTNKTSFNCRNPAVTWTTSTTSSRNCPSTCSWRPPPLPRAAMANRCSV